jgi:hypothetical protein
MWGEMDRWLFIDDGPATGAENMARDEFLLARAEAVGAPRSFGSIRFIPRR